MLIGERVPLHIWGACGVGNPKLPAGHRDLVAYNRAAALQKLGDRRATNIAMSIMTDLISKDRIEDTLRFLSLSDLLATRTYLCTRCEPRHQSSASGTLCDRT